MIKNQKDHLFQLIKSLSKSEKRQFKLYVGRLGVNADSKFLNLFNFLDKANGYNENAILNSGIVKKQQLANVKAHLYKQILISLHRFTNILVSDTNRKWLVDRLACIFLCSTDKSFTKHSLKLLMNIELFTLLSY